MRNAKANPLCALASSGIARITISGVASSVDAIANILKRERRPKAALASNPDGV
jgi:hypothetical protein